MSKNRWERTNKRPNILSQVQRDIESGRSRMEDIDAALHCDNCKIPYLMYEEEVFNPGTERSIYDKCVDTSQWFAQKTGLPFYVVQVHLKDAPTFDDEGEVVEPLNKIPLEITKLLVLRIHPNRNNQIEEDTVEEWQDRLMYFRDRHDKVCSKPSGLHWDRVLRKDVPNGKAAVSNR